ncbi:MAG: leucine-rich repeat domain-containing protein, partial [Candidatus Cloacimonadaceae bacterium]|nr:leucine-rich repeat domain-containing protein [Candidatus Cloacimonadaceae bacterium]
MNNLSCRHRFYSVLLFCLFVFCFSALWGQYGGGNGTLSNPYQISTPAHLNNVRLNPNAYYRQTADIDLDVAPHNTGGGWNPIGSNAQPFRGSFDGNGYAIHNLYLSRPGSSYQALFGYTRNASLMRVQLIAVSLSGGDYSGALLGSGETTTISNCFAYGNIQGGSTIGALAGSLENSSILSQSYAVCQVSGQNNIGGLVGYLKFSSSVSGCYTGGMVSGINAIGGLVGTQGGASTQYSYSFASVNGYASVGGLVGVNDFNATINSSYAIGAVAGSSDTGGLVGRSFLANANDSYWNIQTTTQSVSAGGSGLNTQAMVLSSSYPAWIWETGSTWQIEEGYSYPYLLWQGEAADFNHPEGILPAYDLGIGNIAGPANVYLYNHCTHTVLVTNHGSLPQADYTVIFYSADHTELYSEPGVLLQSGESHLFQYTWLPESLGEFQILAKVFPVADENEANNQSALFTITVYDAIYVDSYFRFTASAGEYNQIVGTPIPSIHVDDAISGIIPIGFSFPYGENSYSEVRISSNGWIGLGSAFSSSYLTNALNSTTVCPVVTPLWDDIGMQTGSVEYLLSGLAPNRVFTVQYTNAKCNYYSNNQFSFQALLHENGRIDFVYGPAVGDPVSPSASIGLNMLPGGTDWFYSITPGDPPSISKTIENNTISIFPAWGTIYSFIPNNLPSPVNLAIAYTPGDDFINLQWTAPAGRTPDSYLIYRDAEFLAQMANTQYLDQNLLHRNTYTYTVVARYGSLDSEPSGAVSQMVFLRSLWSTVLAPPNMESNVSTMPVFLWDQLRDGIHPEPDGYVFELFHGDSGSPVYSIDLGYVFSFTPPEVLAPQTQYTWQVSPYIDMNIRRAAVTNGTQQRLPYEDYLFGIGSTIWTFETMAYLPPVMVQVSLVLPDVNITWMEPGTDDGEWIHYDSGEKYDSIGTGSVADFDVAIRFPASALVGYAGQYLYALRVWPAMAGSFSLRVWTGGNASAPATMVVDQPFIPVLDTYNTVYLDTPIAITGTEELWFGYRCNISTGYPAGCDAGPAIDGFGNMIYFNGAWSSLLALAPILNYNWNIQGFVGYSAPSSAPMHFDRHKHARVQQSEMDDRDRSLTGYKVWRLLQDQETNEAAWTLLTPDVISNTAWTDQDWSYLSDGNYKWAVKALYAGGTESNPAFSNVLPKHTVFPRIAVSPSSMELTMETTDSAVLSLNITNLGDADLEWDAIIEAIFRSRDNNALHSRSQNLRVNIDRNLSLLLQPNSGMVAPGDTAIVQIIVETTDAAIDHYQYQIDISSNDPLSPLLSIPFEITVSSPVAYIPDDNFRRAINEALEQSLDYQPTVQDMESLVGNLFAEAYNIISLEGAQHLLNIYNLYLANNQISYIGHLSNLTNLQYLILSQNQIEDISPLMNLVNLHTLALSNNQITNIAHIENLSNLTYLELGGNHINDISPLANLANLYALYLSGNQLSNISVLAGLINLQYLYCENNLISDISPLSSLSGIELIQLDNNLVSDLSALSGLTGLQNLVLSSNQISDLSPLSSLTNLDDLYLDNNPLSYESMLLSQSWSLPWSTSSYHPLSPCYPDPPRNDMDVDPASGLSWQANYDYAIADYQVFLG